MLYVVLPLPIFLFGWLEIWAAVLLALCVACSLKPLAASLPAEPWPVSGTCLAIAAAVGCAWTACGGTGHLVFANPDWHLRDAVLHDLVTGRWPVGYGVGADTLLRAPIGYYLPAALIGKGAGLLAAHAALAAWTAAGVVLFLVQVLSPTAPQPAGISGAARARGLVSALGAAAVIVLFSGLDVIGTWLQAPGSLAHWDVTRHLEWWAQSYQYSSMTTQLFWVPNHALGGWLVIGLLMREPGRPEPAGAGREPLDSNLETRENAAVSRRCFPSWSWRWRSGRRSRRSEPRRSCCAGWATACVGSARSHLRTRGSGRPRSPWASCSPRT